MYNWKGKSDAGIASLIVATHQRLKTKRQIYDDLSDILVRIFQPRRHSILGRHQKGKQFGAQIYSQAPANTLHRHVGGKIGYMVNRAVPWIQLITPSRELMKLDHIKNYAQESAEQITYAVNRSNFYSMVYPHTMDTDCVGTSVVIPSRDEANDRNYYDVVHPRDSFIAEDAYGNPVAYHRELKLTRHTAEGLFTPDKLPANWYKEDKKAGTRDLKDPLHEDPYLWTVYKNGDRDHDSYLAIDEPYIVFCVLLGNVQAGGSQLVYKNGRTHFVFVTRGGRESGTAYGTSISSDCLTAALVTNKLEEKSIAAAHLVVEPPIQASSTLRTTLQTKAGGRTWVDDINREGAKTWLDNFQWPITDAQMERLTVQMEDRMFVKVLEMLSAGSKIERTAYEVSQMMSEKATLMSTIVDGFEQETLHPVIQNEITTETEAGRMPDVPGEIMERGGRVDIVFLGPLAQLQRSLLRSKGTIDALALIERIILLNEQAGWKVDWNELIEEVSIAQGMPQRLFLSDEAVAEIAAGAQQQAEREQQMEQLKIGAKASSDLAQRVEPRSPMSQLMGQQQEPTG